MNEEQLHIFLSDQQKNIYLICHRIFKRFYLFIFRERGREGERERNTDVRENIDQLPLTHALTGDKTCNPGMCPDQELNKRPFVLWDNA